MKNQQEFVEYLASRGLFPHKYVISKVIGTWARDINYTIFIAVNDEIRRYSLGDRYWNRITTQKVDELLHSYYTLPVMTSLLSKPSTTLAEIESFENIQ